MTLDATDRGPDDTQTHEIEDRPSQPMTETSAGCSLIDVLTPYRDTPGRCDHCGTALTGQQKRWCSPACSLVEFNAHSWGAARSLARKRDEQRCVTCGSAGTYERPLEVNHIVPREGKGYGWGCWNHPENLETLCHDCHLIVTKAQAVARRARTASPTPEAPALFALEQATP